MRTLLTVLAIGLFASSAHAQSITAGEVTGMATDDFGQPLNGVYVILTEIVRGVTREVETARDGRFTFGLLPPGEYQLYAERLGDQPVRVEAIHVVQGRRTHVPVSLTPATPPVERVTTVQLPRPASRIGGTGVFTDLELSRLPSPTREAAELARFSSVSSVTLASEGLPGHFGGVVVDGVNYQSALHEGLPSPDLPAAPFALSSFRAAELLTNGVDVEYAGFAGASLAGLSRGGTRDLEVGVFGDWTGGALTSSKHFDPGSVSHNSMRGGFFASGPVVRDTAHFFLGVEGSRLEVPMPAPLEGTPIDSAFVAIANSSFGVNVADYLNPRLVSTDLLSAQGRLDWNFGPSYALTLRANIGFFEAQDPELGVLRIPGLEVSRQGTDVSGYAALTTSFSKSVGLEQRIGIEYSRREHLPEPDRSSTGATALSVGPTVVGIDPVLPGEFSRFAFRASEALHLNAAKHRLKLGGTATIASIDRTYAAGREGGFVFSDVSSYAALDGLFTQTVGQAPIANYMTSEFGGYLQDTWTPLPGIEFTGGLRVDVELLPRNEVTLNQAWLELTGLANADSTRTILKFSPRLAVVADRGTWVVSADAAVHHGSVVPATLGELVAQSGRTERRQGFGLLSAWPEAPDPVTAPVLGPSLTLVGPEFQPPRTARTSVTFTAALGGGVRFDLSGAYRHTDFLPRRHDLNLATVNSAEDQFGRPIYGEIVQRGGLLAAVPESNRRFTQFDVVSALDPDGYSDYWGITTRLERRIGNILSFFASYTYSETQDNWLSGLGGEPGFQLTPFPDSLDGRDWAEGRSDFDTPHRFTLGAEFDMGVWRLAGFFRGQSGVPFTPGFRPGVDANGDGSFRNDPAYVDDQISGVSDLFTEWDCLRVQVGQFAERNSCRGPALRTIDLRLSLSPVRVGRYPIELVAEGLNLLDPDVADLDNALYSVDPSRSLTVDPAARVVTVPLVANPDFGRPVVRRSTGRVFRIGIKVNYE